MQACDKIGLTAKFGSVEMGYKRCPVTRNSTCITGAVVRQPFRVGNHYHHYRHLYLESAWNSW